MRKIIINWFASAASLLIFALALNADQIPLAVLSALIFAVCLVWFTDIVRRIDSRARRSQRREPERQEFYSIDIPLDEPQDKPAEDAPEAYVISGSGNVHTGMYPSEDYFKMLSKGGSYSDVRREA